MFDTLIKRPLTQSRHKSDVSAAGDLKMDKAKTKLCCVYSNPTDPNSWSRP